MPRSNEELARAMFPETPTQKLARGLGIDHRMAEDLLRLTVKDGGPKWKQPTEAEAEKWGEESMRQVRERFGARTDEVLAKAKTMLAEASPELRDVLDVSRFGSLPSIVLPLAEAASVALDAEAAKSKG